MKKIVEHFVKYPIWANAIIVTVIIFGLVAYFITLKKSFFPEREPSSVSVSVVMPGASPEEMEEGVTIKIEEALKGLEGVDEITSTSGENVANIQVEVFKNYDLEEVATEVKNAVDRISSFPVNAERPVIYKNKPRSMVLWIGMTANEEVSLFKMKEYAEKIEDDLLAGDASKVSIYGYPTVEISVEIKEDELLRYNLTFDQVATAIRLNNRDISAGSILSTEEEILIRSRAKTKEAERIGNIILRSNNDGSTLKIKDIAKVTEQFSDTPNESYMNGKRSVYFRVMKLPEEDIEEISNFCTQYVEKFNEQNEEVKLEITFDFLNLLKQRLAMLQSNGAVGLILVLFCLGLFLSLRLSAWVAFGIPFSFFGMFAIGSLIGITINMISLFGMILVVGILVDDGIVIAENIYTHFERGKKPMDAAVDGTMEVMPAVFTSVLSTIVAFMPLLVIEGFEFLEEMGIVVMLCLAISLIDAFFVLPSHLGSHHVLSRRKPRKNNGEEDGAFEIEETKSTREKLNEIIDKIRFGVYSRLLTHFLKYRGIYWTVPIAFLILIQGLLAGGFIKSTFFPAIPFDSFDVNIAFTAGTREDKVEKYLLDFEKKVWEVNQELKKEFNTPESLEGIDLLKYKLGFSELDTGRNFISFIFRDIGYTEGEQGRHAGQLGILMLDMEGRGVSSFEIANRVRDKIGHIPEAQKLSVGREGRFGKPVSVKLLSKNPAELEAARVALKKALSELPVLKDIDDNQTLGRREMEIELKPKAYFLGLTHSEITKQIRQGFFGEEVQRLQKGTDEVRVWVRYPEENRLSIGQLENMKVKTPTGEYPLLELVTYETIRGVVDIKHYNGFKEIEVSAEVKDPDEPTAPIMEEIQTKILPQIQSDYPSISVSYGGQQRRSEKAQKSFQQILPIMLVTMFVLLSLAFRSFSQAMIIFLTMVPIGLGCAILGHGIEGKSVSLLSVWGMLALSGVIINDTVVLLDKYNQNLRNGMTVMEAAHNAGVARFRAIILTSLTTASGLYPLILEKSFQAQFLVPMAISVAYGVALGTFFNLLIFPVIITCVNDIRRVKTWIFRAPKALWQGTSLSFPTREEVEPTMREIHRIQKENQEDKI